MILVIGRVTAKPDTFDEILRVSREHVHRSPKEPGCISCHDFSVDADDPLTLHFIERWADAEALKTLQDLAADPGAMRIYQAEEISV